MIVCYSFSIKDISILYIVFFLYTIVCYIARYYTESISKDVLVYTNYITILKTLKTLYNLTVVFKQFIVIKLIVLNKFIVN